MKKLQLYEESGYPNVKELIDLPTPYIYGVGARQIGKTYSLLQELVKSGIMFAYVRRTDKIIDMVCGEAFNVFKELNSANHWDIHAKKENGIYTWIDKNFTDDSNLWRVVGYSFAMLSVSNFRGFGATDIDVVFYDEFITEIHERRVRGEFDAFMNAYSSINRNRELFGRKPLKFICMANSNNLASPILMGAGLIETYEKMLRTGKEYTIDYRRGITCINYANSPISQKLKETALYKATKGSDFAAMAFENEFAYNDYSFIENRPLIEYTPLHCVGNITIMKHKSRDELYCIKKKLPCKKHYTNALASLEQWQRENILLYAYYIDGAMFFDSMLTKTLFLQYWKGK